MDKTNVLPANFLSEENSMRYKSLLSVLDEIITQGETDTTKKIYAEAFYSITNLVRARSVAYIHSYLSAVKGILSFNDREALITDGPGDGGVDGYFIDHEQKYVEFIQSKFGANSDNFEEKSIGLDDIAKMHIDRISEGHQTDTFGQEFNGKIKGLIRNICNIEHLAEYSFKVVILANVRERHREAIEALFKPFEVSIFTFEHAYQLIVLPTLTAEQHYSSTITFELTLSDIAQQTALLRTVTTEFGNCNILLALVPTAQVAKLVANQKNAILRYNPRSYLEYQQQRTNEGIRDSILSSRFGEFALLNNGITMIARSSSFTDRIGKVGKGKITISSPQIVNGGQTAFTLAQIYSSIEEKEVNSAFAGKEVLLKVIDLKNIDLSNHHDLIKKISVATNTQTSVIRADREADMNIQREIMSRVFLRTGLLYEYRTGQFTVPEKEGLIDPMQIIDRALFRRLALLADGNLAKATDKSVTKKGKNQFSEVISDYTIDRIALLWNLIIAASGGFSKSVIANRPELFAKCLFGITLWDIRNKPKTTESWKSIVNAAQEEWAHFIEWAKGGNVPYFNLEMGDEVGNYRSAYLESQWFKSGRFEQDVKRYWSFKEAA
ncbi:AIPR family protein [Novosphingopyxis sp. YJ-S2-01]|uniref:AIPR family protein n=1 Tax=Novosphingopyxis sp. YJ-S2-01 TaxID=2794021 RepID=UPI0018DDAAEA|nr:AIPR family protein [Novosphingopyxis sp. YJ-S2-01]MBH9537775.1 AIPR family protein [Novosphingopyxis sp. YJ-S2-01]